MRPEPPLRDPANDPLTELARLIGSQRDPFANASPADPIPEAARRTLRDILAGKRNDDWPGSEPPPTANTATYEPPTPVVPDHADIFPPLQHGDDPRYGDAERYDDGYQADAYRETQYADHSYEQPEIYAPPSEYGQVQPDGPLYGDNGQLLPADVYPGEQYAQDQYQSVAEEVSAEPPRRGRKSLFAVVAVFGLAVLGTAGAYAYRTIVGGGVHGSPPLIRAESTPSKVAAAQSGDGAGKQIYDRLGGDKPQNERVVSREEQPVDVRAAQPRAAFPPPGQQSTAQPSTMQVNPGWPSPPGTTTSTPSPNAASGPNEPRRIRTIPIRSDQLASAPQTVPPAAAEAAPPVPAPAPPPAASTPRTQQVRQPSAAPPAAAGNGPLSLNPQNAGESRPRTATAASPPRAADPAAGAYVVQIAAHKTQEEASDAFRAAQSRYPDVLKGRKALIRKKEVAGKGTFYGAQVGPFASREDATQLCENLKSAGGTCIVQRN